MSLQRITETVGVVFLIQLVILFGAAVTPLSASDQQTIHNNYEQTLSGIQGSPGHIVLSYFTHNFRILVLDMIPGFGLFLMLLSAYATGQAVAGITGYSNMSSVDTVLTFLLFPHFTLELLSYSVSSCVGVLTIYALVRKRFRLAFKEYLWKMIAGCILMLFAAAVVEATTWISAEASLFFWLPIGLGLGFYLGRRRRTTMVQT